MHRDSEDRAGMERPIKTQGIPVTKNLTFRSTGHALGGVFYMITVISVINPYGVSPSEPRDRRSSPAPAASSLVVPTLGASSACESACFSEPLWPSESPWPFLPDGGRYDEHDDGAPDQAKRGARRTSRLATRAHHRRRRGGSGLGQMVNPFVGSGEAQLSRCPG